jgi:hypothetical protein
MPVSESDENDTEGDPAEPEPKSPNPPESITVPDASGNVIVLFAVGSVMANVVVNRSSVAPWNTSGEPPRICEVTVRRSVVALPRVVLPFRKVLPATVRSLLNDPLPAVERVNEVTPFVSKFNAKLSFVPRVVAAPKELPPLVNVEEVGLVHDKTPLPSVVSTCPEVPSPEGSVQTTFEVIESGAWKPT